MPPTRSRYPLSNPSDFQGIRATVCHDYYQAVIAKKQFNCNVISIGGRVIGTEIAKQITKAFLETQAEKNDCISEFQKVEKFVQEKYGGQKQLQMNLKS